jgi:hypothetical protein
MMNRPREAICPRAAFVEAWEGLCQWLVFRCKSVTPDPTKPELQITLDGNCRPLRPFQPLNRRLHSADRSQITIQYP